MRIDKETYGRKAKVEFVDDIFLDSSRRDFTINAIYLNYNGKIYDPHHGSADLKNRTVKFIGEPHQRIKEDRVRILRYFRFLSYYGCNKNIIHNESMSACLKAKSFISKISKERRSYEFFKKCLKRNNGPKTKRNSLNHSSICSRSKISCIIEFMRS